MAYFSVIINWTSLCLVEIYDFNSDRSILGNFLLNNIITLVGFISSLSKKYCLKYSPIIFLLRVYAFVFGSRLLKSSSSYKSLSYFSLAILGIIYECDSYSICDIFLLGLNSFNSI